MKGVGMFLVSLLKGVNFGFWSHSGCSGQNAIMFRREGPRLGLRVKPYGLLVKLNIKICMYCLCFNMVSFRRQKKLGLRPDQSLLGV